MRVRPLTVAFGELLFSLARFTIHRAQDSGCRKTIQRHVRKLLICLLLGLTLGCGTVRIARPDHWTPAVEPKEEWTAVNDAYAVSSSATTLQRKTIWILVWGLNQTNLDPSDCLGNGLAEVRVSTNLGFEMISVLSLGFFQPITVEWRCAKEPQSSGNDF